MVILRYRCNPGVDSDPLCRIMGLLGLAALALVWSFSDEKRKIAGGGWICSDTSREYGDRCREAPGGFSTKELCETICLNAEDKKFTLANLRKFMLDRGLKFPVPSDFLAQLDGPLKGAYEHFMGSGEAGMKLVREFIWGVPILREEIWRLLMLPYGQYLGRFDMLFSKPDGFVHNQIKKVLKKRKDDEKISLLYEKFAEMDREIMAHPDGTFLTQFIAIPGLYYLLCSDGDDCADVINAPKIADALKVPKDSGLEFFSIGSIGYRAHANFAVVNHNNKTIFYFEPNVGGQGHFAIKLLIETLTQPLRSSGYRLVQLEQLEFCPRSLQSISPETDGFCQTWAPFAGFLYIINADKPLQEVFAYPMAIGEHAFDMLRLFGFYLMMIYQNNTIPPNNDKIKLIEQRFELIRVLLSDINELLKVARGLNLKDCVTAVSILREVLEYLVHEHLNLTITDLRIYILELDEIHEKIFNLINSEKLLSTKIASAGCNVERVKARVTKLLLEMCDQYYIMQGVRPMVEAKIAEMKQPGSCTLL